MSEEEKTDTVMEGLHRTRRDLHQIEMTHSGTTRGILASRHGSSVGLAIIEIESLREAIRQLSRIQKEEGQGDLPLEDARQEHISYMVQAAADWLASDDTAYELERNDALRVARGMLQAAFSVVPAPNVLRGPVGKRGQQARHTPSPPIPETEKNDG